jgi:hypothetical protein
MDTWHERLLHLMVERVLEHEETLMTLAEFKVALTAAVADLKASTTGALDRIEADVTELKRKAAEGDIAQINFTEVLDSIRAEADKLKAIDPLPEFPATTEPQPDPEPTVDPTPELTEDL